RPAARSLLRPSAVAGMLGVSKSTLHRMSRSGEGPPVVWVSEGCPRYDPEDVERFIASRRSASPLPGRSRRAG
ncbi:MAG: helix-turn-helix transcriptional regulator, partial [Nakamurella sp.]